MIVGVLGYLLGFATALVGVVLLSFCEAGDLHR